MGRWATLKDASALLDVPAEKLLKQVRQARRRGTKIGNNWFIYVDPDAKEAAEERKRRIEEKRASRRAQLEKLATENQSLRDEVERLRHSSPPPAAAEDNSLAKRLAPLLDGLERQHKSMVGEIEFLRSEMSAMRRQHAEEMQRKDILIQQAHKTLQEVVRHPLPVPDAQEDTRDAEMEEIRQEHNRMARVMGEMSELITVMYRRLRQDRS
jgi:regulator of replication initiation timing